MLSTCDVVYVLNHVLFFDIGHGESPIGAAYL